VWVLLVSDFASKTWAFSHVTVSHKIKDAVPQQWKAVGAVVSIGNSDLFIYLFLNNVP